ncbi:MAG: hypothetical protein ACYDHW_01805 [Syntrophorhabdaceae bacterium]
MRGDKLLTAKKTGLILVICLVMLSGCASLTGSAKWTCFDSGTKEGQECRNFYDQSFSRPLDESMASTDFVAAEFNETLTVDRLCRAITADGYNVSMKAPENTLQWLNELLRRPEFFDKVLEKKEMIVYTPEIKELVRSTNQHRTKRFADLTEGEKSNIRILNRLLIESLYTQESPKAKYTIAVKTKLYPSEEEKKDYLETRKKDNKSISGYENLKYSIFEIDVDCLKRLYRIQGQFDYDGNDVKLEGQAFPFSAWIPIDASMEIILQSECRPAKSANSRLIAQ